MRSRWFHTPQLHTEGAPFEKKASWLELFYDLIYVAAFIQLGNQFSSNAGFDGLINFCTLFIPLWLTWSGFTYYSNRYNIDDFFHRVLTFIHMFCIGAMAITVPQAFKEGFNLFILFYAIAQSIIALMHVRSYKQQILGRDYAVFWGTVFLLSSLFWFLSLGLEGFTRSIVCWIGVFIIMISPMLKKARLLLEKYPIDHEHLSERYGLLTIIVLGESFVKVISELNGLNSNIDLIMQASFALLITCSIWWIYFDDVAGTHLKKGRFSSVIWLLSHLPLQMAIVLLGVGIKKVGVLPLSNFIPLKYAILLSFSFGLALLSTASIDSVTLRNNIQLSDRSRVVVRGVSGILSLLIGLVAPNFTVFWFIIMNLFYCAFQIVFDFFMAPEYMDHHEIEHAAVKVSERAKKISSKELKKSMNTEAVHKGVPSDLKKDLYFFFMETSWTKLFTILFFAYLLLNIFFASLYLLMPGGISSQGEPNFLDAFFFSVQTMSTIGFGALHPTTLYADILVTIEAAVGLITVALVTGLAFAKISRPSAKVLFSKNMLIQKMDGKKMLVFRIGNTRGNEITEGKMSVSLLIDHFTSEGEHFRRIEELKLVRKNTPFFRLSWTVMHEIDDSSPFHQFDPENTNIKQIMITLSGHDSTYSNTVYSRYNYSTDDILVGYYFKDIINNLPDGRILVDYDRFHDTYQK